jgi:hypothetical protein
MKEQPGTTVATDKGHLPPVLLRSTSMTTLEKRGLPLSTPIPILYHDAYWLGVDALYAVPLLANNRQRLCSGKLWFLQRNNRQKQIGTVTISFWYNWMTTRSSNRIHAAYCPITEMSTSPSLLVWLLFYFLVQKNLLSKYWSNEN